MFKSAGLSLSSRILLFLLFFLLPAAALAAPPEIVGILPAGGMRGSSTTLQVSGKNLHGAAAILSGKGVTVESIEASADGESASVKVKIADDAYLGPREIRLVSMLGASNGARIWVDVFPDVAEYEPNEEAGTAQAIAHSPIVINGRSQTATDRDTFSFQAKAEETWVFDCNAARIRSRMDPVLELRDQSGNMLKMVQSTWENDPRLVYRFVSDGIYFVTVRDTQYYGGPDFVYRLTVGQIPAIQGHTPRGERAGRPLGLEVEGVNLTRPRATVSISPEAGNGVFWTTAETAKGITLPIGLLVGPYPVTGVTETDATMPLPLLPAFIDGTFNRFPKYRFFFRGTTKDRFHFEVWARRIGSRVDPTLRILDMTGKELTANDDITPSGQLLEGQGKDSRLLFKPLTDGLFMLEIRNIDDKIGPDCYYRIEARRQEPDFAIKLNLDRIHVGAGGTAVWTVNLERFGDFQGPVTVTVRDLPAGCKFSGGVIATGRNSVEVTLTAPESQAIGVKDVRIVGEAALAGKPAYRVAIPQDDYMHRHANPALFGDEPYVKPYRPSEMLLLGVITRTEPFTLAADSGALTVTPGSKIEITIKASRNPGADGEIKLEFKGLPDKVTAAPAAIPAKAGEVKVTLTAAGDATLTTTNLVVVGKLGGAVQPTTAIPLTVKK